MEISSNKGREPRSRVIVFCGPPCGGKSDLMQAFREAHPEYCSLEMDDLRRDQFPGQVNDTARRNAAYRIMHYKLTACLRGGKSAGVAVNATYQPLHARAELASIVQRLGADLYVVQCICSPDLAVERFLKRQKKDIWAVKRHAGSDLTVTRVRQQSEDYQQFEGALTIDTTAAISSAMRVRWIDEYLNGSEGPVPPLDWARHVYRRPPPPESGATTDPDLKKLSMGALKLARRRRTGQRTTIALMCAVIAIGMLPISLKTGRHLWVRYGTLSLLAELTEMKPGEEAELATLALALAGVGGLFFAYRDETREQRNEAKEALSAGEYARFPVEPEGLKPPSDLEVFQAYRCRGAHKARMPIPGVPIFFLIKPRKRIAFDAVVRTSTNRIPDKAQKDARGAGVDWTAWVRTREEEWLKESIRTPKQERGVRCLSNPTITKDAYSFEGEPSTYGEFLARENSVFRISPGILPDMRRLLEGVTWDTGKLNLTDCAAAAVRYSMRLSITGLLMTTDGYFILQRRSGRVLSGVGNLNGSVAGSVDSNEDREADPNSLVAFWNLKRTVGRETFEEIGIDEDEYTFDNEKPFIGAAFNLRYGRDLNFYSFGRLKHNARQVQERYQNRLAAPDWFAWLPFRKKRMRDKWEVDRLEFLHSRFVTVESIRNGELSRRLSNPSRHLMGALYSWAVCHGRAHKHLDAPPGETMG